MTCWNHADRQATGVCPGCGRATCGQCQVAFPDATPSAACSRLCSDQAALLHSAVEAIHRRSLAEIRRAVLLFRLTGAIFVVSSLIGFGRVLLALLRSTPWKLDFGLGLAHGAFAAAA